MNANAAVPAATAATHADFRARGLTVSLTVKDLKKSMVWYCDVVGFSIVRNVEREGTLRGAVLKAGDVQMLINQDDGARGWDRIKGEGFSLRITTDQSIDEIADRIKARGGVLDMDPADMPWGARIVRLRDLDGYKITISSIVAGR